MKIDLNSDLGEGYGRYQVADDMAMLNVVTSANVACGFHGGDPFIMDRVTRVCAEKNIAVGAHPGFMDLWGFGRRAFTHFNRDELTAMITYQFGALAAMAKQNGTEITHFKAHGALGNLAAEDEMVSEAIIQSVLKVDPDVIFLIPPFCITEQMAVQAGLRVAREIFADRAYSDSGYLLSRKCEGAVIHDSREAIRRTLQSISTGTITTVSGNVLHTPIDSVCIHSDTTGAVEIATALRKAIVQAGIQIERLQK
ncbi:hypothetical protein B5M10_05865 [Pluralibacter gergoviae]|uniref:LamB/YcsF family protein n=1 Tax=Pluralibacter gergoviae TaxID=61647 RepID=UPI0005EC3E72|nr:5-oxoprolinase subunit PxpA [Pluralibacter gergoviae]KJM65496.1 hypothetical protein SS31_06425 [Pluralibacter gergoviae]OUR03811.1 hypothetical protein B5M10_05865 [Pluralibacter gergoviae]